MNRLDSFFELSQRQTTIGRELRGSVTTFLTMAYIVALNPAILSSAGVPFEPAVACTALAAGVCCILMGLCANFPIALASGMGLNAFVAFAVAKQTGSWQTAMGLVVLDGIVILVLVLAGLRGAMLEAIPVDLRRAMAAGIGLLISLLGAVSAGIVESSGLPNPPIRPGEFSETTVVITFLGVVVTGVLLSRRVPGAILLGILITAVGLSLVDALDVEGQSEAIANEAAVSAEEQSNVDEKPSSWTSRFSIAFQADVLGALQWKFLPLLLSLLMVDFFDTLGTVTALADQSELKDEQGRVLGLKRILVVDSISAGLGGVFGVSSVTSYIESAAGISEGARTGLHSVFVGLLFLLCIFAAPFLAFVPSAATAPALIIVGFLMCEPVTRIDFRQTDVAISAFLTLLLIPMTYSISHGIGYGILSFVAIRGLTGRCRDVHPLMYAAGVVFATAFWLGSS